MTRTGAPLIRLQSLKYVAPVLYSYLDEKEILASLFVYGLCKGAPRTVFLLTVTVTEVVRGLDE